MKKVVLTLLSLALVIAQSCTTKDEENLGAESKSEFANKNDLYIDKKPNYKTNVDANKMATLFKGVTPTTRAAAAYDVTPLSDTLNNKT